MRGVVGHRERVSEGRERELSLQKTIRNERLFENKSDSRAPPPPRVQFTQQRRLHTEVENKIGKPIVRHSDAEQVYFNLNCLKKLAVKVNE